MRGVHFFLTLAFMLVISGISFAQAYTIAPNDTVIVDAMMEDLETLSITQTSKTEDTLFLKWKKISESIPDKWDANVCDNQFCYPSLLDSGTMNPVLPGEYGLLIIHCTAKVNYGKAVIRYAVWDARNLSNTDTLTYIINSMASGNITSGIEPQLFWFGNNKIHLTNKGDFFETLYLMDLSGREIFKASIDHQKIIELPTLSTSVYIIRLSGKEKQFNQKIFYQE